MQTITKPKRVKYGKAERMSFAKIDEKTAVLPYLLEIQKEPYKDFLKNGIAEVLEEYSPIKDRAGKVELYFLDHTIEKPLYTAEECRRKRLSYTAQLKVRTRLVYIETGEAVEQEVFMGDIPLMTDDCCFIVNGVERVIISQIVKSPSCYFDLTIDKTGKELYSAVLHSLRGTRLSIEQTLTDELKITINQASKLSAMVFLKACTMSEEDILETFNNNAIIQSTIATDKQHTMKEALLEIARKTRPNDVPNSESTQVWLNDTFYSNLYYNFGRVGRYKYNKKLMLATRIAGLKSAENITIDDEIVVMAGEIITPEVAERIQYSGINSVDVVVNGKKHRIIGNARVRLSDFIKCNEKELGINEMVYYPLLKQLLERTKGSKEKKLEVIKQNAKELVTTHLTLYDIIGVISYILDLNEGLGNIDNIDHLANRRIFTVGELMANEFRKGVSKLKDNVLESMQNIDTKQITPSSLISARAINKFLRDFLASGQLSQITEDFNPAATLTNKRRISAVGPGGIKKERAGAEVRDIHYSHYGRICAVETPEGQGIGLINGIAAYARINEYGFLETPYRKIDKEKCKPTDKIEYLMADTEENYYCCQAIEPLNEDGTFKNEKVLCRKKGILYELPPSQVDYMDVCPRQFISAITSLIPFLENDDTVRALTGSNMQRQAVPLLRTDSPIVATGIEHRIAMDSGAMIISDTDGIVTYVDANEIKIQDTIGVIHSYKLTKFQKTNKETCFNQKPNVNKGDEVKVGDVIADGFSTQNGELALGKNVTIAFMNWEGYNYEDAILINENLVKDDTFTSIALKVEECAARQTKLGDEEITRDIPNVGEDMLANLDERGIVRIGAEVKPGDILVGKVTPKGETDLTPEERLLRAIFGEKAREVRDNSLKVPHGSGGIVVDVQVFERKNKDELDAGVNTLVKVFIAKKRKVSVGDKMAGRHGNKGVVSRVLPQEDMPFQKDGTPIDIVLNPLGVPSRMNIGQVLEVHLGLIAKMLGWKVATPSFNGANEHDIKNLLEANDLPENGKMQLYDGRTGEPFENKVTVGIMYMIKLEHMSETKIHARSIGSYALVTRQPLGGKAMFGGQRFGEMEVWALYAYGASHLLQEILTVKSDDVSGRTKAYESIVKGEPIQEPGIPESFKVLVKEFQALGLDVTILTDNNRELSISDITPEEHPEPQAIASIEEELKNSEFDDDIDADEDNAFDIMSESFDDADDFGDDGDLFDDFEE